MKDLFDMTRHARRGMVAMLIAIAVVLLVTVIAKSQREPIPHNSAWQDTTSLEVNTDTLTTTVATPVHKGPAGQRSRKHPQRRPAKPKPDREPRRLDPVPTF
jgi:cell division protein FtsN